VLRSLYLVAYCVFDLHWTLLVLIAFRLDSTRFTLLANASLYPCCAAATRTLASTMVFDFRDTLSGVVGSICCVYVGLPFDVIKLRLQTQQKPTQPTHATTSHHTRTSTFSPRNLFRARVPSVFSPATASTAQGAYRGPIDCLVRMLSTEGIRSLWKGAVPALSSGISENAALFTANDALKRIFTSINRAPYIPDEEDALGAEELPLLLKPGSAAQTAAAAAAPPTISATTGRTSSSSTSGRSNAATSGRNSTATVATATAVDGASLATDVPKFTFEIEGDESDEELDAIIAAGETGDTELTVGEYYLCGGIAGIFSCTVMCPSEVIKVRLQYQRAALSSPSQRPLVLYTAQLISALTH
jgi:solute carrier family 25 (mitochondrial ornithine transporter) member 2/15